MRHLITILLANEAGALARLAGMFAARGYNIEQLSVGPTQNQAVSRLTLVVNGDDVVIQQIVKQSRKLLDIIEIVDATDHISVAYELLLVNIHCDASRFASLERVAKLFGASVRERTQEACTLQLVAKIGATDKFIRELSGIGEITEMARTGAVALLGRS